MNEGVTLFQQILLTFALWPFFCMGLLGAYISVRELVCERGFSDIETVIMFLFSPPLVVLVLYAVFRLWGFSA